jgi:hypothetical protein
LFAENTRVRPGEKYLSLMAAKQSVMLWSLIVTGPIVLSGAKKFAVLLTVSNVIISWKQK